MLPVCAWNDRSSKSSAVPLRFPSRANARSIFREVNARARLHEQGETLCAFQHDARNFGSVPLCATVNAGRIPHQIKVRCVPTAARGTVKLCFAVTQNSFSDGPCRIWILKVFLT